MSTQTLIEKQQSPEPQTHKFKQCPIFIMLSILLIFPLIFISGSDHIIDQQSYPLYQVFNTEQYQKLKTNLNTNQYTQIIADKDSHIEQFLISFANSQLNNETIAIRRYKGHINQEVHKWCRLVRYFVEDYLQQFKQQDVHQKIWVLVGIQNDIPVQDIYELKKRYPHNKIILITKKPLQIKQFKVQKLPSVDESILQKTIQEQFKLTSNSSKFLLKYFKSISSNQKVLSISKTQLEEILQQHHQSISELNQEQRKILDNLCKYGVSHLNGPTGDLHLNKLSQFGALLIENEFYWKSPQSILNYALQADQNCLISSTDQQIISKSDLIKYQIEKKWQEIFLKIPQITTKSVKNQTQIIIGQEQQPKVQQNIETNRRVKQKSKPKSKKK